MVNILLRYDWYGSIFSNDKEMEKFAIFHAPFLHYMLPPDTKIICPRINFREKKTKIDNQYKLYSTTCGYESSMLEGVEFTV